MSEEIANNPPQNSENPVQNTEQAVVTETVQEVVVVETVTEKVAEKPVEQVQQTKQPQQYESRPKRPQRPRGDTIYGDVRSLCIKILTRVERTDAYLDKLIDFEVRNSDFLNEYDKSLLNEICHGVIRWMRRLDWFLNGFYRGQWEKCMPEIKNALRVALYQILFLDKIPDFAAVNEAVEFVKRFSTQRHADVVNGLLRTIIRTKDHLVLPTREIDEVKYLGLMYSHPNWMTKRWIQRFGFDDAEKLASSNNKRPILTLRVNTTKVDKQGVISKFNEKNIAYRFCRFLDYFITLRVMSKIYLDEDFKNGYYTIQDESAGLASVLLRPTENDLVLDMCAAPGGKTTHLAQIMKGKGKIIATDKYDIKVQMLEDTIKRLGFNNIECVIDDAAEYTNEKITGQLFDKILLDAPCSGLGVLSKKPEIRWKRELKDILELAKIQKHLLEEASKRLKPGGVMVYSTCTTEPEENMEVIKDFLSRHPEFSIDDASRFVHRDLVNAEGCIETFPHKHYVDGSFAARLVKKAEDVQTV